MAPPVVTDDFKNEPWWWEGAPRPAPHQEPLPSEADVVVVGSGFFGTSAALTLAEGGRAPLVLEAGAPGFGASTRNAGFVSRSLLITFKSLAEQIGIGPALDKYRLGDDAYFHTLALIERLGIDCHAAERGRFLPTWNRSQYDATAAQFEFESKHLDIQGGMLSPGETSQELHAPGCHGGLLMTNTASVHPGKYQSGLMAAAVRAGSRFIGGTRVTGFRHERDGFWVQTSRGRIKARDVLIATNAYTGAESPWFRRRVVRLSAYMAATEPLDTQMLRRLIPSDRTYIDYSRQMFNWFRAAPDASRLLFGGQAGVLHKSPERMARLLHEDLLRIFPDLERIRFSHVWGGRMAITADRWPHLGVHDGIHYAIGCNGPGLTIGSYLGNRIARRMLGDAEARTPFDDTPFRLTPSIAGYPWFMPFATAWRRFQDWRGVPATGH